MAFLKLKVGNKQGIAKIELKAKSANYTAAYGFEVDVRSPNPVVIENDELRLEPGKSHTFQANRKGVPGPHMFHLEISKTDLSNKKRQVRIRAIDWDRLKFFSRY